MAVGMAVGVIAVISLLLVGILMITGSSDKSEKIIVPDLIGRNIDEVLADPDITDNFMVKEATERQESDRPVGEILEQDPDGDGKKKGNQGYDHHGNGILGRRKRQGYLQGDRLYRQDARLCAGGAGIARHQVRGR